MNEENIPLSIQTFLDKNNYELVKFKGMKSIYKVKCAYLKSVENHKKNFLFEYDENKNYYFFIVKKENPKYLNQIDLESQTRSFFANQKDKKANKGIIFDFDYNKYILYGILGRICEKSKDFKHEKDKDILLNREICAVSHATYDGINYYKLTKSKSIKLEKSQKIFDNFNLMLEKYYIIEIENKKPVSETTIKEDGIISVLYLLTPERNEVSKIFTMIKYTLYFIKETLINYIGKYIHDLIYDFSHLPSEIFSDFLSHIGCLYISNQSSKICLPLKSQIKQINNLSRKNLIQHIYRNLTNISRPKANDRVPFHKFIQLYEKYNMFYSQKEFKIKDKLSTNSNYKFMNKSIIFEANDKITKEHKVNLKQLITNLMSTLSEFLLENMECNNVKIKKFMMSSLSRFIKLYTSLKGFFNIDIVINEESMFEFHCFKEKKKNKTLNKMMMNCVHRFFKVINLLFEFNEGFFHKHFTVLDYSYNFNEKDVIHTFPSYNDSSKKNKIRIYDIPFIEKWNYYIATLIMIVYKDLFGFLNENKDYLNNEYQEKSSKNFFKIFSNVHETISNEFFQSYEIVLPDYFNFCERMSKYPLDKYNCIDSVCQHFTNNSLEILLRKNIIFFSPFNVIYKINNDKFYNRPNLNSIFEPYLILVDSNLKLFLEQKENKEEYLKEKNYNIKTYFEQLKLINSEKIQYSIFLSNQDPEDSFDQINTNLLSKTYIKNYKNFPERLATKESFDFYYLFNLYYFYTYKTMIGMRDKFIDYDIIKRYIDSTESSVTISFTDFDKTIIKANTGDIKKVKKNKKITKIAIQKDLIILEKLNRKTRVMNLIFLDYIKNVIKDIRNDYESGVKRKEQNGENNYIKIGHYLINFLLYGNNPQNINSLDEFFQSSFYNSSGL
jgi:hypothetical protein